MCTANQISNWEVLLWKFQWSIFHSKFNWHLSSGEGAKGKNWLVIVYLNFNSATCSLKQQFPHHHKIHLLQATGHFSTPHIIHPAFCILTDNRVALLEHFTTWYPTQGEYFKTSSWHCTFEFPGMYCLPYLQCLPSGGLPLLQAPFQFLWRIQLHLLF